MGGHLRSSDLWVWTLVMRRPRPELGWAAWLRHEGAGPHGQVCVLPGGPGAVRLRPRGRVPVRTPGARPPAGAGHAPRARQGALPPPAATRCLARDPCATITANELRPPPSHRAGPAGARERQACAPPGVPASLPGRGQHRPRPEVPSAFFRSAGPVRRWGWGCVSRPLRALVQGCRGEVSGPRAPAAPLRGAIAVRAWPRALPDPSAHLLPRRDPAPPARPGPERPPWGGVGTRAAPRARPSVRSPRPRAACSPWCSSACCWTSWPSRCCCPCCPGCWRATAVPTTRCTARGSAGWTGSPRPSGCRPRSGTTASCSEAGVATSYAVWASSRSFAAFLASRVVGGASKGNVSLSTAIVADLGSPQARSQGMVSPGRGAARAGTPARLRRLPPPGGHRGGLFPGLHAGPPAGRLPAHDDGALARPALGPVGPAVPLLVPAGDAAPGEAGRARHGHGQPGLGGWGPRAGRGGAPGTRAAAGAQCCWPRGPAGPARSPQAPSIALGFRAAADLLSPLALLRFSAVARGGEEPRRSGSAAGLGSLRRLGLVYFLYLFLFSGLEFTLSFLVHQRFQFSSLQQGKMFFFIGLTMAAIQGTYARRIGPGREVAAVKRAILLLLPAFLLVGWGRSLPVLGLGLLLYSFAAAVVVPCLSSAVAGYGSPAQKGTVMGTLRSLGALARAVGPLAAASVYWLAGAQVCFSVCSGLFLLPVALLCKLRHQAQPKAE
nr:major facilitator superfamily domain-containing protein 10 isoform X2 [Oryctolagus cuniculus]